MDVVSYAMGEGAGYSKGYNAGYDAGLDAEAYQEGYDDGKAAGYEEGYSAGEADGFVAFSEYIRFKGTLDSFKRGYLINFLNISSLLVLTLTLLVSLLHLLK